MKGGQGKAASDLVGLTSGNVEEYAIELYRKGINAPILVGPAK